VEFSTPQEAQRAMTELNDTEFMGRQVFIREDREEGSNRQMNAGNPMHMQMHMQQPVYQHPHQHQHQYPQQMQQQAPLQMQPVSYERPERPPRQTVAPGEGRRIYVGNLSWEVSSCAYVCVCVCVHIYRGVCVCVCVCVYIYIGESVCVSIRGECVCTYI
jgi:RNA recognition motif-containing protein